MSLLEFSDADDFNMIFTSFYTFFWCCGKSAVDFKEANC